MSNLLLEAYPLTWPTDQLRTPNSQRERGQFKVGFGLARDEMLRELSRMGAKEVVISTNVPTRLDGLPYADAREPQDPGVAVYFTHGKRQLVIACDSYQTVKANLRAVPEPDRRITLLCRVRLLSREKAPKGERALGS
jgi:hypothetical protein